MSSNPCPIRELEIMLPASFSDPARRGGKNGRLQHLCGTTSPLRGGGRGARQTTVNANIASQPKSGFLATPASPRACQGLWRRGRSLFVEPEPRSAHRLVRLDHTVPWRPRRKWHGGPSGTGSGGLEFRVRAHGRDGYFLLLRGRAR